MQNIQDNSKSEVILYETVLLLFNCNKKYFTKILKTFSPAESARVLGSWQYHDTNEGGGKSVLFEWKTQSLANVLQYFNPHFPPTPPTPISMVR